MEEWAGPLERAIGNGRPWREESTRNRERWSSCRADVMGHSPVWGRADRSRRGGLPCKSDRFAPPRSSRMRAIGPSRSEEHTSELQSRPHLVCRLLLEKKKPKTRKQRNKKKKKKKYKK